MMKIKHDVKYVANFLSVMVVIDGSFYDLIIDTNTRGGLVVHKRVSLL